MPLFFPPRYPRHRKLISINKVNTGRQNYEFNLRHDWNSLLSDKPNLLFKRVSSEFYPPADSIILYLNMFEKELGLNVKYEVDIGRIRTVQSQAGRSYILTDQHASEYKCRYCQKKTLCLSKICRKLCSLLFYVLGFSWLPQGFGFLIISVSLVLTLLKVMSPCPLMLMTTGIRQYSFWARVTLLLKQLRTFWERQVLCTCSAPTPFDWPGRHTMLEM